MKVCIITCNNAENYGARLQAYALASYIRSIGHDVEVIDYEPDYVAFRTRLWYNPGLDIKEWARLPLRYRQRQRQIDKHKALEEFAQRYLPLTATKYHDTEQLRRQPPEADVYVAGSDQIWNTDFGNGRDPAYYLDFGPKQVRRISYAASYGTDAVAHGWHEQVSRWLNGLDAVSVREDSAVRTTAALGCTAVRVCDPAFLLSAAQWSEIATRGIVTDGPYLLVYDFERSEAIGQVARRIAVERDLKIYSVSPEPVGYAHKHYCTCTPEDFIALIAAADCVVSNSLHGSIFAIIYERDFIVVNRGDGLNLRMSDLLNRYRLGQRIARPDTPIESLIAPIDYASIRRALTCNIEASKAWLNANLSNG